MLDPLYILPTDYLIGLLMLCGLGYALWSKNQYLHRQAWRQIAQNTTALPAAITVCFFALIAVLDSIHFMSTQGHSVGQVYSLLDVFIQPITQSEVTYSEPFSTHLFHSTVLTGAQSNHSNMLIHVQAFKGFRDWLGVIGLACVIGALCTGFIGLICHYRPFNALKWHQQWQALLRKPAQCRTLWIVGGWLSLTALCVLLASHYHIFGTDKVGDDVFYQCIKSIRTGLVIGSLTTLFMLPFALFLGLSAGFFGGMIDDIIQTIYTTLSSIPAVLLISTAVLTLQIFMSIHADWFPSIIDRADMRLLALCLILGVTGWTPLARLLRAETFKLREMAYIDAAKLMGSKRRHILFKHLLPNVMHLVLITIALDFSGLVLAEAVLSYVGVGVDPTTYSWGNMINAARLELARDPIVWWPLLSAFIFMFALVWAANVLADALRLAFNPHQTEFIPH